MGYYNRLNNAFTKAPVLPLDNRTKYVLISDCHRGNGTSNDNFLKNQHLYFAALQYYYKNNYTYIELGDGDELWENRNMSQIIEIHSNVFWLLTQFLSKNRLYMLYGNHDMIKKNNKYKVKHCSKYFCSSTQCLQPLFDNMPFLEGIILQSCNPRLSVFLTHGHQADINSSVFWKISRFLVRYLWSPLERFGVLDPTSAAKNNTVKKKIEKRLNNWAQNEKGILITGHTHRPMMGNKNSPYYNTGSCVHPRCITCIEICGTNVNLVKWCMTTHPNYSLYVSREIIDSNNLKDFID